MVLEYQAARASLPLTSGRRHGDRRRKAPSHHVPSFGRPYRRRPPHDMAKPGIGLPAHVVALAFESIDQRLARPDEPDRPALKLDATFQQRSAHEDRYVHGRSSGPVGAHWHRVSL